MNQPTDPSELFRHFAAQPHCVWLDTATGEAGQSILAAAPSRIFRSKGSRIEILTANGGIRLEGNPFDVFNAELSQRPPAGAAIGYFGYDLKNFVEKLPARAEDDLALPDCWFGFYDKLHIFKHNAQIGRPSETASHVEFASNFTRESYRAAVLRAKEYIAAGDIYQVNLSQRFQCSVEASPVDVYLALRTANPAPYCAYLDIGDAQILSSSPECFLDIRDRHVVTRPIKGTRRRAADPAELLASPKDNAELLMITDLERNDLGRVCQFGSVYVRELKRVETFATVHHLVATVEGLLRRDVSHVDCVRACFPGGSITGAPKIRAMQIIDELEPKARGVYTGAIGYFDPNGESHFNIAIRTMVYQSIATGRDACATGNQDMGSDGGAGLPACGRLTFHAGSGIVADSDPDSEYDETLAKAQGIFNAIDQLRLR